MTFEQAAATTKKPEWRYLTVESVLEAHDKDERGCWIWRGSISKWGYGRLSFRDELRPAHAVYYELLVGEIPSGLEIDHLCRNRLCVNPDHLEPVTHSLNVKRGYQSRSGNGNSRKTHCLNGHPLFGENLRMEKSGRRACRKCRRVRNRKHSADYYQRNREACNERKKLKRSGEG